MYAISDTEKKCFAYVIQKNIYGKIHMLSESFLAWHVVGGS